MLGTIGREGLPLCYAGGTALNCPANSLMAQRPGFASLHIPPWCDDSGLSLGAALALYHNVLDQPLPAEARPRKDVDAYLGAAVREEQVGKALSIFADRITSEVRGDWAALAAQDLADDKVIGWLKRPQRNRAPRARPPLDPRRSTEAENSARQRDQAAGNLASVRTGCACRACARLVRRHPPALAPYALYHAGEVG
jgi:hypothetical protein